MLCGQCIILESGPDGNDSLVMAKVGRRKYSGHTILHPSVKTLHGFSMIEESAIVNLVKLVLSKMKTTTAK